MKYKDKVAEYFSESKKNFKSLMDTIYQAEHHPEVPKDIQQLINFHKSIIKNLENTVPYSIQTKGRDIQ